MKRLFMPFMLATLVCVAAFADDDRFSRETFTLGEATLYFRLADICHNATENSILVLYLHGGSARGDDNEAQLREAAVSVIYQYLYSRQIPATFIVPQCPSGGGWTGQLRRVVNEMVKSYANDGSHDPDRIYVLGGSMGGTGTWAQLSYYPNFYAAAMPVAGNPTGLDAAAVATTPVLTVMGTADNMMSIPTVKQFQTEVLAVGGTLIFETEEGWSHPTTCEQSYTDQRLDWLFSWRRSSSTSLNTTTSITPSSVPIYNLNGRKVSTQTKGIYLINGRKVIVK
jgi:predicted peptidase